MRCEHKSTVNPWGSRWWYCIDCGSTLRPASADDVGPRFRSFDEWLVWWHSTMDRMTNHWADSATRTRLDNKSRLTP